MVKNCNRISSEREPVSEGKLENASSLDMSPSLENSNDIFTSDNKKNTILSRKKILQAIVVTSLILTSIALLSIPIITYYVKSPEIRESALQLPSYLVNLQTCEGTMDLNTLNLNSTKLTIMNSYYNSSVNQDDMSFVLDTFTVLLYISSQLGNTHCNNILLSLHAMDRNNDSTRCIGHEECSVIRDTVCAIEWRLAENVYNFSEPLFKCCNNDNQQPETTPLLNCTDEFVLVCNSICATSCENFSQYSESVTKIFKELFKIVSIVLMIGAIFVIILSIVKRKTMFTFPQIYLVFGNICLFVVGFCLALPPYLGQDKAFCSDRTLVFSLLNPTTICKITGFGVLAGLTTYAEFWFLHIIHTLLKLAYPFSAQKFEDWYYFKMIYAAEIIIPIVLGSLPFGIILSMNRFTMIQFPAVACYPNNTAITFYTFTLPVILLQMAGTSATIILLKVLYNHMGKSQLHKSSVLKLPLCSKSNQLYISIPVVKISIVFLSYTAVLVMNWILFITLLVNKADTLESIQDYSTCSAIGDNQQLNAMCDMHKERLETLSNPGVIISAYIMLGSLPFFSVTYIIRVRNILKYFKQPCSTVKEQITQHTHSNNIIM